MAGREAVNSTKISYHLCPRFKTLSSYFREHLLRGLKLYLHIFVNTFSQVSTAGQEAVDSTKISYHVCPSYITFFSQIFRESNYLATHFLVNTFSQVSMAGREAVNSTKISYYLCPSLKLYFHHIFFPESNLLSCDTFFGQHLLPGIYGETRSSE